MKLLIADDDVFFRRLLESVLAPEYDLIVAEDGEDAWRQLQQPDPPRIAILDWVMPKMTGPQLCRKIRDAAEFKSMYLIILTVKDSSALTAALHAGADDYVTKPFDVDELRARLHVGQRIIGLQDALADQVANLQNALAAEKRLRALLPTCPGCGTIRNDPEFWSEIEDQLGPLALQLAQHKHCPNCAKRAVPAKAKHAAEGSQ